MIPAGLAAIPCAAIRNLMRCNRPSERLEAFRATRGPSKKIHVLKFPLCGPCFAARKLPGFKVRLNDGESYDHMRT